MGGSMGGIMGGSMGGSMGILTVFIYLPASATKHK
jgi:hypothetical protein